MCALAVIAPYAAAAVPANAIGPREIGFTYAKAKCGSELAVYRNAATFPDLDPWDTTRDVGNVSQVEPGMEPIAAWMMSMYSVMNELSGMASTNWPNRARREKVAVAVDAALELEECLSPSGEEWRRFDEIRGAGRSDELRSGACLLQSAAAFRDVLQSDLEGQELSNRIVDLREAQSVACQRKN
jgi:hypothetical protein